MQPFNLLGTINRNLVPTTSFKSKNPEQDRSVPEKELLKILFLRELGFKINFQSVKTLRYLSRPDNQIKYLADSMQFFLNCKGIQYDSLPLKTTYDKSIFNVVTFSALMAARAKSNGEVGFVTNIENNLKEVLEQENLELDNYEFGDVTELQARNYLQHLNNLAKRLSESKQDFKTNLLNLADALKKENSATHFFNTSAKYQVSIEAKASGVSLRQLQEKALDYIFGVYLDKKAPEMFYQGTIP